MVTPLPAASNGDPKDKLQEIGGKINELMDRQERLQAVLDNSGQTGVVATSNEQILLTVRQIDQEIGWLRNEAKAIDDAAKAGTPSGAPAVVPKRDLWGGMQLTLLSDSVRRIDPPTYGADSRAQRAASYTGGRLTGKVLNWTAKRVHRDTKHKIKAKIVGLICFVVGLDVAHNTFQHEFSHGYHLLYSWGVAVVAYLVGEMIAVVYFSVKDRLENRNPHQ